MRQSVRIWILLLLAALTLLVRTIDIAEVALRGTYHWMTLGYLWEVVDNRMVIRQVAENDFDGRPNPFHQAGLQPGDQLIEIRGAGDGNQRINGFNDYGQAIRSVRRDESATIIVGREERGRIRQLRLEVPASQGYGFRSWMAFWSWALVFPLIAVGTGFFIGFMRPSDDNAFTAALTLLCFSSYFAISHHSFPSGFRELGSVYQTLLAGFMPYTFMRFFLLFPTPSVIDRMSPGIKRLGLILTVIAVGKDLYINHLYSQSFARLSEILNWPWLLLALINLLPAIMFVMFLLGVFSLILNTLQIESKAERRRLRILLAGTLVGLVPLIFFLAWVSIFGTFAWEIFFLALSTLIVFPLSFAYAVVRHRVMGIQLIIHRGIRYALVSRGFLVVEWLVVFSLFTIVASPVLNQLFTSAWAFTFATVVGASIMLAGVHSLNKRIMPMIDRRFFREAYNTQQILTGLSHDVRKLATSPDQLLKTVIDRISDSLYSDQVAVFVRGAEAVGSSNGGGQGRTRQVKFNPHPQADYQCHWHLLRTATDIPGQSRVSADSLSLELGSEALRLPQDAFVPNYLERFVDEEPEALDVYLDDPRSWTQALARQPEQRHRERALLEQLHTRLLVPLIGRGRVLGFISLGEKLSEEPYSKDDKQLLLTVAEQTSVALDYAYLIEQVADQEKLKQDLEIAKEVQNSLFPNTLPPVRTLQYMGVCKPARQVGGDYYDFLALPEERLCLALGDISGKGISAALLMASLQALLRSHAGQHGSDVKEVIADINRLMCATTSSSRFATFFCGFYDDRKRTLTYVNAGHNPPLLFRPDDPEDPVPIGIGPGEASALTERTEPGQTIKLETGGMVIGVFPQATYEQETIELFPGDVLVTYSDGISEARNEKGEEYGEERLEGLIRNNIERSASGLCQLVFDTIRDFAGQAPQHDDMTVLVAKAIG